MYLKFQQEIAVTLIKKAQSLANRTNKPHSVVVIDKKLDVMTTLFATNCDITIIETCSPHHEANSNI